MDDWIGVDMYDYTTRVRERLYANMTRLESGCWQFNVGINGKGYGTLTVPKPDGTWGKSGSVGAHRLSYEIHVGPIPDGLVINHLCYNRRCINPEHLEVVTAAVNQQKRRPFANQFTNRTHCPKGHEYTPENTSLRRSIGAAGQVKIGRSCRQCRRKTSN